MKRKWKGWLFFAGIFAVVCIGRIWYGLFLVFAYALLETAWKGKRSFCYDTCPIGNILDYAGNNPGHRSKPASKRAVWAGWVFFGAFSGYVMYVLTAFAGQDSVKWLYFFRLMAGSMILALFTGMIFQKRFWCLYMCPLSKFMKGVLKWRRR